MMQGYYRRGTAYLALGKFKDALKDFRQVPHSFIMFSSVGSIVSY